MNFTEEVGGQAKLVFYKCRKCPGKRFTESEKEPHRLVHKKKEKPESMPACSASAGLTGMSTEGLNSMEDEAARQAGEMALFRCQKCHGKLLTASGMDQHKILHKQEKPTRRRRPKETLVITKRSKKSNPAMSIDVNRLKVLKRKGPGTSHSNGHPKQRIIVLSIQYHPKGRTTTVRANPMMTAGALKEQISKKGKVDLGWCQLIFNGNELEDDRKIIDYGIENNSRIHLVLKRPVSEKRYLNQLEKDEQVEIYVETVTKKKLIFLVTSKTSEWDLKNQIVGSTGIPEHKQHLSFEGVEIEKDELSFYGVREESVLQLRRKHPLIGEKNDEMVKLFVRMSNMNFTIFVNSKTRVSEVKKEVAKYAKNVEMRRVCFTQISERKFSEEADDSELLSNYEVEEESTIFICYPECILIKPKNDPDTLFRRRVVIYSKYDMYCNYKKRRWPVAGGSGPTLVMKDVQGTRTSGVGEIIEDPREIWTGYKVGLNIIGKCTYRFCLSHWYKGAKWDVYSHQGYGFFRIAVYEDLVLDCPVCEKHSLRPANFLVCQARSAFKFRKEGMHVIGHTKLNSLEDFPAYSSFADEGQEVNYAFIEVVTKPAWDDDDGDDQEGTNCNDNNGA